LQLAIVLVGSLEGRCNISVSVLEGQAEWPQAYILQLRCVKSGDQFSNQSMGDVMFVCVSSPVAAKRTCCRRVEGSANYKEHKLCFCLKLIWRDSLKDKWPGIRSSFSKKVGWNAGLDPIVASDANLAFCCRCSSSADLSIVTVGWRRERLLVG
jgi:hypothetical protein